MYELSRNTSLLGMAIDAIADAKLDFPEAIKKESLKAFGIENKIKFNSLKRNKSTVEKYFVFYSKINTLYSELEAEGSFKKENLLRNINLLYLKAKGKYVEDSSEPQMIIQENADNIYEDVEEAMFAIIEAENKNFIEDATFGISVILVDAFIKCKILEEPPAL